MNDKAIQQIAIAITQALGLESPEQALLVIQMMSPEGILAVAQVLGSKVDLQTQLANILQIVYKDIEQTKAQKALNGAKLNYIKKLRNI